MILCFSGNGNSRMVADRLGERLGDTVTMLRGSVPFDINNLEAQTAHRVVWVMPVHSWGMPVAVARTIESLDKLLFGSVASHYLVLTCGDDCGHAHLQWRRALGAKGWKAVGEWSVQMPNTYVLLPGFDVDSPEVAAQKLAAMPARVGDIASQIMGDGRVADVVEGSMPGLKTRVVYPLFARYDIHPRKFRSTDACVGCGRCAATCPLDNIGMVDRRPSWGDECTLCLGCYNCCPVHAIRYGRRSGDKGQYFAG